MLSEKYLDFLAEGIDKNGSAYLIGLIKGDLYFKNLDETIPVKTLIDWLEQAHTYSIKVKNEQE